ncbi:MAG: hydantoinase/oxoprolinase family protein [Pseudomonadota bacterium]|nr:hydantoinase/oxoprolinase family protein [Pseudomonadota bacterium]
MSGWQAGVDVGGTNTDLLFLDPETDSYRVSKVATTTDDQSLAVLEGLQSGDTPIAELAAVVHGTTIATNAVLERKGARCGLITTRGFRDVLELGRRTRPNNYGMTGSFEPLIDRELRLEVSERLDARGRVVTPLDEDEVRTALQTLESLGADAIVIHFLHAYANPVHEKRAAEIAGEVWKSGFVSTSSEILREVREFERGSTAAVNAYVQPVLAAYLDRISQRLNDAGFLRPLLVMQGNGGTLTAQAAARQPVQTVMSGPAAGAVAAAYIGKQAGFENLIACDMGGTSFDVSVIIGSTPALSSEKDLAYGIPVRVPMVDIHTIGAGGGSIARVDSAGLLRVGPESAGAQPGPVCYGRGGSQPTVTDANLVLGHIDVAGFAGVAEHSDGRQQAAAAIDESVGRPLGLDTVDAAAAILAISSNQLASAIRLVSIEKGHDPRDFALFAFGGAGPLHAVGLARELGIPRVLVPRFPGITSALGCLISDLRHDYVETLWRPLAAVDPESADQIFRKHAEQGRQTINDEGVPTESIDIIHEADLMYQGQSHVFRVRVQSPGFSEQDVAAAFAERYRARFDIVLEDMTPVLASLRTTVIGRRPDLVLKRLAKDDQSLETGPVSRRSVYFAGEWIDTPVYVRDTLVPQTSLNGPAVVQQADTTCLIDPEARATVDADDNLIIETQPDP